MESEKTTRGESGTHIKMISRGSPLLAMPGQTRRGFCAGSINQLKQCITPQTIQARKEIRNCNDTSDKQLCESTTLRC